MTFYGNDNGEDKDNSDWVMGNDSVMSDDGESDEQYIINIIYYII